MGHITLNEFAMQPWVPGSTPLMCLMGGCNPEGCFDHCPTAYYDCIYTDVGDCTDDCTYSSLVSRIVPTDTAECSWAAYDTPCEVDETGAVNSTSSRIAWPGGSVTRANGDSQQWP